MAITTSQVVVGATEASLVTASSTYNNVTIRNTHATDALFVGATGLSTSTGYSIAAGSALQVSLPPSTALFGIRGANAITATVLSLS